MMQLKQLKGAIEKLLISFTLLSPLAIVLIEGSLKFVPLFLAYLFAFLAYFCDEETE